MASPDGLLALAPPHTARSISFSNNDAQMCLLCQLPGQAYNLALMAPPKVRAGSVGGERGRLAFCPKALMQMGLLGRAGSRGQT